VVVPVPVPVPIVVADVYRGTSVSIVIAVVIIGVVVVVGVLVSVGRLGTLVVDHRACYCCLLFQLTAFSAFPLAAVCTFL
jgi:hypothetical protein